MAGARAAAPLAAPDATASDKLHPALLQRVAEEPGPVKAWVFFADKGIRSQPEYESAIGQTASAYNPRAVQRRAARGANALRGGALFDWHDLPLVPSYVDAVASTGARIHVTSTWVNAVSVYATREQLDRIAALPFVSKLQPVARSRRIDVLNVQDLGSGPFRDPDPSRSRSINYGASAAQLSQINLIALHDAGHTGQGVVVGILDTGFHRTHQAFNNPAHPLVVLAEHDFINNDGNTDIEPGDPSSQHNHGTMILGCLGAYMPGSLVGGAYDASFVLAKTEDTAAEYPAEEDNYVAGLQFIEANGADMSTASLGYIDWYTQADLDGQTAVTTIAVNIATANGLHHCNAAGNEYHDSNPNTSNLIAPADAFQVITCGAVTSTGAIASFSSDGPTADGRVKPEVLARGVSTNTVSPSSDTGYTTADGTSLSTPVVACAIACLVGAKPYWTVDQMRQNVFETSDYFVANGTHDPLYVRGYGIVNAFAAYGRCSDAGVVTLDRVKYACESTAEILVNDCGLNTNDNLVEAVTVDVDSDSETGVEQVTLTETGPDSAEFIGAIQLSITNSPGVLWVAHEDTLTVTYIDADDGIGGTNAVVTATAPVDCLPPVLSNVEAVNVQPRSATIAFDTDEPVRGTVHYGESCGALADSAVGSAYSTTPTVGLADLSDNTTYYYTVDAEDQAGNVAEDDNGGSCYTFSTPEIPDYFTEQFTSDNDLENVMLVFTPNGAGDFYAGCAEPITEFPTNPAGGTVLSLTDDAFATINLTGGAMVSLYGTSYGTLHLGANGYITFTTGDGTYDETPADHFDRPRISALFDDLSPQNGGTVSWKQLADRVAATWQNVPEYSVGGSNTFQIEMLFDGTITISYLAMSAPDGIVGLSAGGGVPAEFFETDLSAMGNCGPKPPIANNGSASTPVYVPMGITLLASDDGLPEPPASLDYIITQLPAHGELSDAGAGVIESVPYTLAGGGNQVEYAPYPCYRGADSVQFKVNDGGTAPEGGDSEIATVSINVTVSPGTPVLQYTFPMNSDPGWSTEGLWAFGQPVGSGTHNGDPPNGYTGPNVYGYNLSGDYTSNMAAPLYLTASAIDCTRQVATQLRFRRWLGVEGSMFDHASVQVSSDGANWTTVWQNGAAAISDTLWSLQTFDISSVADGQSTVYVRWGIGPTDGGVTYPGWNIDDVEIWAILVSVADVNGDQAVDLLDYSIFDACLAGPESALPADCGCADLDGDDDADLMDFGMFQHEFTE